MPSKTKTRKPLTAEEANARNPGGGALVEAAARKKAAHEAMVAEVVQQLGLADKLQEIKLLPMDDRKVLMLQFNFAGLSLNDSSKLLDINIKTAMRWFREEPEAMQKLVRQQLSAESLAEVGPTWARLQGLRFSENAETARKASLDCLTVAGMGIHGPGGLSVTVNAPNAQLSVMPISEIERTLVELAKLVGPNAEKIVDAEVLAVRDLHGNGNRREKAPVDPGSPGQDQGPVGGTAPEESQPAD